MHHLALVIFKRVWDPLFALTTCLKTALSSSMKSRRDDYLFSLRCPLCLSSQDGTAAVIVCLEDNHLSGTSLHNPRHSSRLHVHFYLHEKYMLIGLVFFSSSCIDVDLNLVEGNKPLITYLRFSCSRPLTSRIIQTGKTTYIWTGTTVRTLNNKTRDCL